MNIIDRYCLEIKINNVELLRYPICSFTNNVKNFTRADVQSIISTGTVVRIDKSVYIATGIIQSNIIIQVLLDVDNSEIFIDSIDEVDTLYSKIAKYLG